MTRLGSDMLKTRKIWMILGVGGVLVATLVVAGWTYHKQPEFCAVCHEMKPYLESWSQPDSLAYQHAEEGIACLDCHEPTIQQQANEAIAHVKGDFKDPLKQRKFESDFCLDCHLASQHTSYEQVIERTADYVVDGETVNPHEPHVGLEDVEQKRRECYVCHDMHRESTGLTFCYGCHHQETFQSCSDPDCHGGEDDQGGFDW